LGSPQVGNGMATLDGYTANALNGADFPLVSFTVGGQTADPVTSIPSSLVPVNALSAADASITRDFTFAPGTMGMQQMIEGPFTINGTSMDMGVINVTVPLGQTEIWSLANNTMVAHPFHVHDVEFNILDRNGAQPDVWEHGWKDVVYVPPQGTARIIARFDDFADPVVPYMYHCHMLMHEDEGMMGQFVVVDPDAIEDRAEEALRVWPLPADHSVDITWSSARTPITLCISDGCGRTVDTRRVAPSCTALRMETSTLADGPYLITLTLKNGQRLTRTLIVQHDR
ncbi:MAG TPA: multicopper oxidase domain-containing protein, partial [Flavobacteriales bacterium]|nr:multicopper oxidase domain-containing protein [Flavobacteriales bacterium]